MECQTALGIYNDTAIEHSDQGEKSIATTYSAKIAAASLTHNGSYLDVNEKM